MPDTTGRRSFLKLCAAGGLSARLFGALGTLVGDESHPRVGPDDLVRFASDVEPLVQLIETVPRERCVSSIVDALRAGTSYRELMAALYLAGIRNLTPSPGGALHAVFVIHSAHEMGLDLTLQDRVLPMFWALDNFKATQARSRNAEKLFNLQRTPPSPETALDEFRTAMDSFDADRAEVALVSLLQTHGSTRITEELWTQGARDYRAIGHKAIYVANACRTLDTIGWRHAEPTLRHVVRALAAYGTDGRINGFNMDEQSHAANLVHAKENAGSLPGGWGAGRDQPQMVRELIAVMRTADHASACRTVVQHLRKGHATAGSVTPSGVWNGRTP